jgi:5'-deoxynucleotidase YfbR-like HD superfamily hydrolase
MCRFNGSVRKFYSIAEHSVRVSQICSPENQLWGLLHDSGEFATADVNRPLKYSPGMGVYRLYERKTQAAIMQHFGQPTEEPAEVKAADRRLLVTEQRDLMAKGEISPGSFRESYAEILPLEETIIPWTSKKAEREFLARFRALTAESIFDRPRSNQLTSLNAR